MDEGSFRYSSEFTVCDIGLFGDNINICVKKRVVSEGILSEYSERSAIDSDCNCGSGI